MRKLLLLTSLSLTVLVTLGAAVAPGPAGGEAPTDAADRTVPPARGLPTFAAVTVEDRFVGGEPNVAVGPDGRIYVTALGGPSGVWRSDDDGATFARVSSIVGESGDSDVVVDDDGTVYVLDMMPDIPVSVSLDHAATYVRTTAAGTPGFPDRPWMASDGTGDLYVIWNGEGGIRFSASNDAALTWSTHNALVVPETDPTEVVGPTGPIVVAPDGALLFPVVVGGAVELVRSADGGATWHRSTVTAAEVGKSVLGIFPVAAVDDAGVVYVVWSERVGRDLVVGLAPRIMMAASTDGGATFSSPVQVSQDGRLAVFPWVVAGARGRVAVFWLDGVPVAGVAGDAGASPGTRWFLRVAQSPAAHLSSPAFTTALVTPDVVHTGSMCAPCTVNQNLVSVSGVAADRRMLDFFEAAVDNDGNAVVAWTQDPPLEEGLLAPNRVSLHFAKQVGGPRLR